MDHFCSLHYEILSTQKIEQANRYNGIKDVNAVW